MKNKKLLNLIGSGLLLAATIAWGTSFFILKEAITELPTFYVIAVRFLLAGLALFAIFFKKIKGISKKTFFKGVIIGLVLASAYFTQTIGLDMITPGRNAFLTATYCVMCPFIIWIMYKKRPKFHNIISAVLCLIGVGLVSLSGKDMQNYLLGDIMTLIGAVFFSLQIIFIDQFQKQGHDTFQMLVVEILSVGVIFTIYTLLVELPQYGIASFKMTTDQMLKIGYLTLACTLFAQFAQIVGQKFVSPNQSALILTFEAVFGVLFSVLFAGEKLTLSIGLGFVVIFVAMLISELGFDFKKRKKVENTQEITQKEQE